MTEARKRELAKIHIAKAQLRMTEDAYRAMLLIIGGATSSGELTALGRSKVLHHLHGLGWRPRRPRHPRKVAANRAALMRKIEAQLADMALPWAYADAVVRRMHGIDSVRFANAQQLRNLVAALTYEQRRREDRACPECGQAAGHAENCPEGEHGRA